MLPSAAEWQRLSPWLDGLLDRPAEQREPELQRLSREDPQLAADLRSLLSNEDASFLDGQADPWSPPADAQSLAGSVLGAYTLEAPLGQGGAGAVWRARRSDGRLDQQVAIKLLHFSLLHRGSTIRFRREGSILARLSHAHIARLLDAGVTQHGQPYLVLELVEGEPIDVYCRRLDLPVEARLALFLDVLSAVGHAHRHLVVHRDIKPANVLVTAEGTVKLLDFGIAKLLDADPQATRDAGRALTPAYAAPEQFDGGEVTTATDVYALGLLLYQLLVGRHPIGGAGTSTTEFVQAVLHLEPIRPSRAVLRQAWTGGGEPHEARLTPAEAKRLSRRLAGDLDNIVARMLRKVPAERYATVAAVADDLRRHLADEPVSARPDGWRYRSAKFLQRHRTASLAGVLAGAAIVAGWIGTWSQARRAAAETEIAQLERDRALRELRYAEAANEFIGNVLTEGSRRTTSSVGLLDQASELLEEQFAATPTLRARMQLMLGTMYGEMNEQAKAQAMVDRAAALAENRSAQLTSAERTHVECLRASLREDLEALNRALERLPVPRVPAAARTESAQATADVDARYVRAICLTRRSVLLKRQDRVDLAVEDASEALALLDASAVGRQLAVIHARRELASAIGNQGRNAEAAAEWRALLADLAARGRANSVYAATARNNLFVRLSSAGQEKEAYEEQLRAIAIWSRLQGEEALDPHLWANLATSLDLLGRTDEALTTIRKALSRIGPDTAASGRRSTWVRAALLLCRGRQLEACEQAVAEVDRLLPPDPPPGHIDTALRAYVEAAHRFALRDAPGEREALLTTVRIADASAVRSAMLPGALERLASVELRLGRPGAALEAARRMQVTAAALSRGYAHNSLIGRGLLQQARAEIASGRLDAARRSLAGAVEHLSATTGTGSPLTAEARDLLVTIGP
jgi:serine/threonine-protein kinase